jgi:hypothetical protein
MASLMMPAFLQSGGVDALNEFRAFQTANQIGASVILSDLIQIQNTGTSAIPASHGRVATSNFWCAQDAGWAVFYAANGPLWGNGDVTVVLVGNTSATAFSQLESGALTRKQTARL